jgi:flagellar protein FlbD
MRHVGKSLRALAMIHVTRINHVPTVLNSDLIEHVETTPDTVISLTTGHKFVVLESADEVVRRVIAFRREILAHSPARES